MKVIIAPRKESSLEIRGYESYKARKIAVRKLIRLGYNYFIGFKDVQAEYALQFCKIENQVGVSMTDCYPTFYHGARISCTACKKRHSFRTGDKDHCAGSIR